MNREDTYLFVDGAYLERTVESHEKGFFNESLNVNYEKLIQGAIKGFYYDAYPSKKSDESESTYLQRLNTAENKFKKITSCRGWHCNFGVTKGSGKRTRQKGVDIQLAMDAFTHCVRGNFKHAIILTGDLDFFPLIKSLIYEGAFVELWCDPASTSSELIRAADARKFLGPRDLYTLVNPAPKRRPLDWSNFDVSSIAVGETVKTGSYSQGEVRIVQSECAYYLINHRTDLNSFSVLTETDLDRLIHYAKSELFYVVWSNET